MASFYRFVFFMLVTGLLGIGQLPAQSVEICDNAIDDDGDGLIDLNDKDCDCPVVEPVSLIPNPSFEDKRCCPTNWAQMNCVEGWVQASSPTTDYIHLCDWEGRAILPTPKPFPDGQACIGYTNGIFGTLEANPNWKEYIGVCLKSPLRAHISYKFQFHIGFTHAINSPPTEVAFFATKSCNELPFGIGQPEIGCPTNGPDWVKLGEVSAEGKNQWKLMEIIFTPEEDYSAMAIGPNCSLINSTTDIYYFFDNLMLVDHEFFAFDITLDGGLCEDVLSLAVPNKDGLDYQWYKNGIALVGEDQSRLRKNHGDGDYQVKIQRPNVGCRITQKYEYRRPRPVHEEVVAICKGESFLFDGIYQKEPGIYIDSLKTREGCDSVSILHLDVLEKTIDSIKAKIFPSEYYHLGTARYYSPGIYTEVLTSSVGCDSTVVVNLSHYEVYLPNAFSPNGDGINDVFSISGSEEIIAITKMKIFNRWGNLVYEGIGLSPFDLNAGWDGSTSKGIAAEGVYVFVASILFDDGKVRLSSGSITLLK